MSLFVAIWLFVSFSFIFVSFYISLFFLASYLIHLLLLVRSCGMSFAPSLTPFLPLFTSLPPLGLGPTGPAKQYNSHGPGHWPLWARRRSEQYTAANRHHPMPAHKDDTTGKKEAGRGRLKRWKVSGSPGPKGERGNLKRRRAMVKYEYCVNVGEEGAWHEI